MSTEVRLLKDDMFAQIKAVDDEFKPKIEALIESRNDEIIIIDEQHADNDNELQRQQINNSMHINDSNLRFDANCHISEQMQRLADNYERNRESIINRHQPRIAKMKNECLIQIDAIRAIFEPPNYLIPFHTTTTTP